MESENNITRMEKQDHPVSINDTTWQQEANQSSADHPMPRPPGLALTQVWLSLDEASSKCSDPVMGGGCLEMDELAEGPRRKPKTDVTIFVLQEASKEAHQHLGSSSFGEWPTRALCSPTRPWHLF